MKLHAITDTGKVRKENQDAFSIKWFKEKERAVMVTCDGMGGARAGRLASSLAIETFMREINPTLTSPKRVTHVEERLKEAAAAANRAVYEKSLSAEIFSGMGTTLVALFAEGSRCRIVNIGDSRAYHISGKKATRITRDHSFVEELVTRGKITAQEAQFHPRRNLITRAVGVDENVESDTYVLTIKKNDYVMLCSDGLSNLVMPDEMSDIFRKEKEPEPICKALISLSLERGAPDNITAAVLYNN